MASQQGFRPLVLLIPKQTRLTTVAGLWLDNREQKLPLDDARYPCQAHPHRFCLTRDMAAGVSGDQVSFWFMEDNPTAGISEQLRGLCKWSYRPQRLRSDISLLDCWLHTFSLSLGWKRGWLSCLRRSILIITDGIRFWHYSDTHSSYCNRK